MCCKSIASSAVCRFPCQVFGNSHAHQVSVSGSHTFPLFPYTHTYSVIEPSVDIIHVVLHTRYSIVVKPPSCIYLMHNLIWDFCSSDRRFAHELVSSSYPASFRFEVTLDTLAFGYILPTTGRIRDFNPLETCAARRTIRKTCQPECTDPQKLDLKF